MSRFDRSARPASRMLVMFLTLGLAVLGFSVPQVARADTAPDPGVPATVSADALPTWQINGVVWSQVVVGNTVYATGSFTKARPPGVAAGGVGEIPVGNLIAYEITTGGRIASFDHTLNAQGMVVTASPDGTRIIVGGDFTAVDGSARQHIAMFNATTGALDPGFFPYVGGQVRALAATNSTVYVGGAYTAAGGATRNRLSAFTFAGALTSWAPSADDNNVWTMVLAPDGSRVIVGGAFTTLNGQPNYGMGSVDATTGALLPWAINQTVRDAGTYGAITSLTTDGVKIYGAGYSFGSGTNFEGTFAAVPSTGAIVFVNDCHGDTYDTFPIGQVLYSVSHTHDCTWVGGFPDTSPRVRWEHALAQTTYATGTNTGPDSYGWNYNGLPDSTLLHFFPQLAVGTFTGQSQAAWSVKGNSSYVVMGGEFPSINGTAQQGLARFAVKSIAPNKRGPTYVTTPATPVPPTTAASFTVGTARVGFGTGWDYDNESLKYDVLRDGKTWVYSTQLKSNFWTLPSTGFIDTGLAPGSSHVYQVRITDPYGNAQWSYPSNTVTISSTAMSAYAQDVISDGVASYWRLGEPSGTAVVDYAGFADATAGSGVTRGAVGAISGDSDSASTFSGNSSGTVGTNSAVQGPQSFTLEAWVRTTTNQGGKIIGFGNVKSGNSSRYDRQLYLDNAGHIWFGVNPGSVKTISSNGTYRDGSWHHIVASLDATNGMALFVDGKRVAGDAATTSAQVYTGYWRIGGDNLNGWPNKPKSGYLNGAIDEVAIYPTALTVTQVQQHYLAAGGILPNQNPTAAFTSSTVDLVASFDASGSSDLEGPIASYSWNFGDGTPAGAGVTPSHTYATSGTKNVTLTVTDQQGATGSLTKAVTVTDPPPNQNPTASFTSSAVDLVASFDGSSSSDPDGTVASYSWSFGDGSPAGSGATPSHTYASAGTYQVVLTVTDNQGGTGSVTNAVTVTVPPPNQNPTAAFTSSVVNLAAVFDGSGSSDPDGTVASYSWDFGDGSPAGSGATPSHTYASAGTYQVVLTVTDNQGGTGSVTNTVTVTAPNQPPVAAFTSSATELSVSFDGSGSTDPDGSIGSYAWDFGDGTAAWTGVSPTHAYAVSGTYQVTLTVTDNQSATGMVIHPVTVTTPLVTLASDDFGRTLATSWGAADIGGAWSVTSPTNSSVGSGVGNLIMRLAGSGPAAYLNAVSSTDADVEVQLSVDKLPLGGTSGADLSVIARRVGTEDYRGKVRILATGAVRVGIARTASTGAQTLLSGETVVAGLTYAVGDTLVVRVQATGTSPTLLKVRVWKLGSPEPATWQLTTTDTTATLQAPGAVGVHAYLSAAVTNAPITVSYDKLRVWAASTE